MVGMPNSFWPKLNKGVGILLTPGSVDNWHATGYAVLCLLCTIIASIKLKVIDVLKICNMHVPLCLEHQYLKNIIN